MKFLLLILLTLSQLFSAPALGKMRQFTNADGTTFMAKARGDQHLNWIQTDDGEILRYNQNSNNFEYAIIKKNLLQASGIKYEKKDIKQKRSVRDIDKINEKELFELWNQKKLQHYQRVKNSQK